MRKKIALIGAGNIGGTMAHLCLQTGLADCVLFDINEGLAKGKALDLMQAGAVIGSDINILGTADYSDIKACDVVIVTAGLPRKPGMSRDELLSVNSSIMRTVGESITKYCPEAFVICVTNPLDVMVRVLQDYSKTADHMICGMAGVLDSARFSHFLADELKVSVSQVASYVLGGHGDTMLPLVELSNVSGISLTELVRTKRLSSEKLEQIVSRTRKGGGEIVNLLKTGSAYYAPAHSAIAMADAYLNDLNKIFPVACKLLNNEYGVSTPLFVGVPAKINATGIAEVIEVSLSEAEQANLQSSIDAVIELNKAYENLK
jgi:malate dehydrogenase